MLRLRLQIIILVLLVVSFRRDKVHALKCWSCSSDSSTSKFCDDPFDPSAVNEDERRLALTDCESTINGQLLLFGVPENARPVCKKLKQWVNDKLVVSRTCAYEDINSPADLCSRLTTPSYIRTEFCETCHDFDGCNGDKMNKIVENVEKVNREERIEHIAKEITSKIIEVLKTNAVL